VGIEFEQKTIKKFEDKVEQVFSNIERDLSNPRKFENIANKARQGLKENKGLNYKNSQRYSEVKSELKKRGVIAEDKPIQVTGQLIEDLRFKILKTSPDEIITGLTFDHSTRIRPTLSSMFSTYSDPSKPLETKSVKSSEVAKILIQYKGIPIIESLRDLYSKDFQVRVENIIKEAFEKV